MYFWDPVKFGDFDQKEHAALCFCNVLNSHVHEWTEHMADDQCHKNTKQNRAGLSISEFVLRVRFVSIQLVVVTSPRVKHISPEDLNHVKIYAKDYKSWSTEKAFYQAHWAQKG